VVTMTGVGYHGIFCALLLCAFINFKRVFLCDGRRYSLAVSIFAYIRYFLHFELVSLLH
jgi:hypothetical protein